MGFFFFFFFFRWALFFFFGEFFFSCLCLVFSARPCPASKEDRRRSSFTFAGAASHLCSRALARFDLEEERRRESESKEGTKTKAKKKNEGLLCSLALSLSLSLSVSLFSFPRRQRRLFSFAKNQPEKCRRLGRRSSLRRTSPALASIPSAAPTDTAPGAARRSPRSRSSGGPSPRSRWRRSSSL